LHGRYAREYRIILSKVILIIQDKDGGIMQTSVVKVTEDANKDVGIYEEAGRILREGGLVAFPTETVYGLGGNGLDESASRKIYAAKGRPSDNPLILHIADTKMLYEIAEEVSDTARKLIDAFWPGPLTIVFKKAKNVPYETTGGLDSVAVRMPSHPVAAAMIRAAGVPIAAPSANVSGRPSPTLAKHVEEDMTGKIEMIIDGGSVGIGIESTIVDMTGEEPVILRPGYVTKEMMEAVIGAVGVDPTLMIKPSEDLRPKAPGMKYRHYAPKAELTLYEGSIDRVAKAVWEQTIESLKQGARVAIIATEETKAVYDGFIAEAEAKEVGCNIDRNCEFILLGSRLDAESIARNLYAALRECDEKQVDYIFSETFSLENFGQAIMNRLRKAAGYNIINLND